MTVELERPRTSTPPAQRPPRVDLAAGLTWLLLAVPVVSALGFLAAAYFRLTYAYPMWVVESASLQAVRRILAGLPLYGPPALEYTPTLYAPLYFYVSAAFATLLGPGLSTLRLVSLLASIGSTLLIAYLVWSETHSRLATVVAGGLFICSTAWAETTLDLARVDPLSLCLLLAALALVRASDRRPRRSALWLCLLGGVVLGLSGLTKQTALLMSVLLAAHLVANRRPAPLAAFGLGLVLTLGLAALVLTAQYGRWPEVYLVDLPRQHALQWPRLEGFWSQELLPSFTLPVVAVPIFLVGCWLDRAFVALRFWLLVTLGMLAIGWGASLNQWSGQNVIMPTFAVLSAGFGLGLAEVLRRLDSPAQAARAFRTCALLLGVLQFAFVHYNPRQTSPLRSDTEAGQRLVAAIQALPGQVYGPEFPELVYDAGKGDNAFGLSVGELQGVFGGKPRPEAGIWSDAYARALDERRFDVVLLEVDGVLPFLSDSTRDHGYVDQGPLVPPGDEFYRLQSRYMPGIHVWVPAERVGR